MFSISLSEVIIVIVVMLLVYNKEDYKDIIKTFKNIKKQIAEFQRSFYTIVKEITGEEELVKKIIGDDGKEYTAYNLDLIMPDIKDEEKKTETDRTYNGT